MPTGGRAGRRLSPDGARHGADASTAGSAQLRTRQRPTAPGSQGKADFVIAFVEAVADFLLA